MTKKILLTSFQTWLPHHKSNSSDDLLLEIAKRRGKFVRCKPYSLTFLRQLPVDAELASSWAIAKINSLRPDAVICCGMAECRTNLTVESHATCEEDAIATAVNLDLLVAELTATAISHEAGKFVCEALYYSVLKYLREHYPNTRCIFVHVPILDATNLDSIVADFLSIIKKLVL